MNGKANEPIPVLTGRLISPFVRRVAVTMAYLNMPFERKILSIIDDVPEVEKINPLGRVPALIMSKNNVIIDSAAILDHYDQQVDPELALVPLEGTDRGRALYLLAIACGAIEKSMVANGERKRPAEKQMPDKLARQQRQTVQGFVALEAELDGRDWFMNDKMMQPDITCAVGVSFIRHIFPGLLDDKDIPALSDLTARCEALPAFEKLPIG